MDGFRVPILGWQFAGDFLSSKTTHFAFTVIVAAVTGFTQHKFDLFQATVLVVGSVAVACLRDAHSKWLQTIGNDLFDIISAAHLPIENPDGGEVPEPAPKTMNALIREATGRVPEGKESPPLSMPNVLGDPNPVNPAPDAVDYDRIVTEVIKRLHISPPNPKEAAESGTETPAVTAETS